MGEPVHLPAQVSTRIRNHETATLKVNDADGNPIEIAAVVVWQVADTARAIFAVDDFIEFVAIQSETAVRHIATSYPYDARDRAGRCRCATTPTRSPQKLSAEIAARWQSPACTWSSRGSRGWPTRRRSPRRCCAASRPSAVVAARQRIVEGAVGMVELALDRLRGRGVVELDEERKAAMVSNLLVVLCGEQATQPVVNTGSLYQ